MKSIGYGIAAAGFAIASAMSTGTGSLIFAFWGLVALVGLLLSEANGDKQ